MVGHRGLRTSALLIGWVLASLLSVCLARSAPAPRRSREYCYSNDTRPYHRFATKTPYDYARGHFAHRDLVPEGKSESNAVIGRRQPVMSGRALNYF